MTLSMWRTTVLFGYLLGAALSDMIQTVDHVRAVAGDDAHLTCRLTQPKNVLQVTWQRMIPGGTEDVGSCNKRFGTKVNPPFRGLVEFEDTGLQNTAIVVRNVTKADDGRCYRCLFNAYPEGAIYRKTCLTVYEQQPEPTLNVTEIKPNGTEQTVVVSCAAQVVSHRTDPTTVTLEVHVGSSKYSSSVLRTAADASANGTVTLTSAVTLQRPCDDGATQVRCVVRLHSGVTREASTVICSDKQDVCRMCAYFTPEGFTVRVRHTTSHICRLFLAVILVGICVAAVGVGLLIVTVGLVFRLRQGKIRTKEPLATQKNKPIEYPNT